MATIKINENKENISIQEWILEKTKRGEVLDKIPALIPEVANSDLLIKTVRELVENDFHIPFLKKWKESQEVESEKLDRLFFLKINEMALAKVTDGIKFAIQKNNESFEKIKILEQNEGIDKKLVEDFKKEVIKEEQETQELMTFCVEMVNEFKNPHNAMEYVDNGKGQWLQDDKEKVLELVNKIPIAKDDLGDNILSASKLLHKIDEVLVKIEATITKIDEVLKNIQDVEKTKVQEQENDKANEPEIKEATLTSEEMSAKIIEEENKKAEEKRDEKVFKDVQEVSENDKIIKDPKIITMMLENQEISPITLPTPVEIKSNEKIEKEKQIEQTQTQAQTHQRTKRKKRNNKGINR